MGFLKSVAKAFKPPTPSGFDVGSLNIADQISGAMQDATRSANLGGTLLTNPLNAAGGVVGDVGNVVGAVGGGLAGAGLGLGGSLLTGGLDLAQAGVEGSVGFAKRYGDKVAQLGKEAISGKGGYGDDAGEEEVMGPTGGVFSEAKATGLTGIRTAKRGTLAHRSKGTASKVNR
tara:strand:+ start:1386 stop:1907 length:522 start_codon:yes stop_codon:yes gene_type:complete